MDNLTKIILIVLVVFMLLNYSCNNKESFTESCLEKLKREEPEFDMDNKGKECEYEDGKCLVTPTYQYFGNSAFECGENLPFLACDCAKEGKETPFELCERRFNKEYCKHLNKPKYKDEKYASYCSGSDVLEHCKQYHRECKLYPDNNNCVTAIDGKKKKKKKKKNKKNKAFKKCKKKFGKNYCKRLKNKVGKFTEYCTHNALKHCRQYHRYCKLDPNDDGCVTALYGKGKRR